MIKSVVRIYFGYSYCFVLSDPPKMPIDDFSAQDFRDLFDLNVLSYFLASKVSLTHYGLMTPYGDIGLGQHWLS